MNARSFALAACAGALSLLGGCVANPLVGTWVLTQETSGLNQLIAMTLGGDGKASFHITFAGSPGGPTLTCSGPGLSLTGFQWTSTATTLSVTGTQQCSGSVTCTSAGSSGEFTCAMLSSDSVQISNATYAINNNALTVSQTGRTSATFTRR